MKPRWISRASAKKAARRVRSRLRARCARRASVAEGGAASPAPYPLRATRSAVRAPARGRGARLVPGRGVTARPLPPRGSAPTQASAAACQVKACARRRPAWAIRAARAGSLSTPTSDSVRASTSVGSTSSPASPATSGREEVLDVITGVPQAIASSTGSPNPSYCEG